MSWHGRRPAQDACGPAQAAPEAPRARNAEISNPVSFQTQTGKIMSAGRPDFGQDSRFQTRDLTMCQDVSTMLRLAPPTIAPAAVAPRELFASL